MLHARIPSFRNRKLGKILVRHLAVPDLLIMIPAALTPARR